MKKQIKIINDFNRKKCLDRTEPFSPYPNKGIINREMIKKMPSIIQKWELNTSYKRINN